MLYPITKINLVRGFKHFENFQIGYAIDWALEELSKGNNSESMLILASLSKEEPFGEAMIYIEQALSEFGTFEFDKATAHKNLVYFYVDKILKLEGFENIKAPLYKLYSLYSDGDFDVDLLDFALVYWQFEDVSQGYYGSYLDIGNLKELEIHLKSICNNWINKNLW